MGVSGWAGFQRLGTVSHVDDDRYVHHHCGGLIFFFGIWVSNLVFSVVQFNTNGCEVYGKAHDCGNLNNCLFIYLCLSVCLST